MPSSRNDAGSRDAPARLTVPGAAGAASDLRAQWEACGGCCSAPGGGGRGRAAEHVERHRSLVVVLLAQSVDRWSTPIAHAPVILHKHPVELATRTHSSAAGGVTRVI